MSFLVFFGVVFFEISTLLASLPASGDAKCYTALHGERDVSLTLLAAVFLCVLSRVRFRGDRLGLFVTGIGLLTVWCCEIVFFWERIGLSHDSTNF